MIPIQYNTETKDDYAYLNIKKHGINYVYSFHSGRIQNEKTIPLRNSKIANNKCFAIIAHCFQIIEKENTIDQLYIKK